MFIIVDLIKNIANYNYFPTSNSKYKMKKQKK